MGYDRRWPSHQGTSQIKRIWELLLPLGPMMVQGDLKQSQNLDEETLDVIS